MISRSWVWTSHVSSDTSTSSSFESGTSPPDFTSYRFRRLLIKSAYCCWTLSCGTKPTLKVNAMCDYSAVKKPCFSSQTICQKSIDILLGYSFNTLSKVCNLYPRKAANDVFGKQSTSWSELRVHLCCWYKARVFLNSYMESRLCIPLWSQNPLHQNKMLMVSLYWKS